LRWTRSSRFEEALRVIVPLMRGSQADFEGTWHAARDLPQAPMGPRPGRIPLMIGGNGPKGQRLAARYTTVGRNAGRGRITA
jgi:alkanesulfonate monooxygenase SsuD/methylene tetrahydromethanopterin reductase-like flavin-dependent oxidoreductase (luciferase family)